MSTLRKTISCLFAVASVRPQALKGWLAGADKDVDTGYVTWIFAEEEEEAEEGEEDHSVSIVYVNS